MSNAMERLIDLKLNNTDRTKLILEKPLDELTKRLQYLYIM